MNEAIDLNVGSARQIYKLLNVLDNLQKHASGVATNCMPSPSHTIQKRELEFWVGMAKETLKEIGYKETV